MSASRSGSWVCASCGSTNSYRVHNCAYCGEDRAAVAVEGADKLASFVLGNYLDQQESRPVGPSTIQRNSRKRYAFLSLACLSFFAWATLVTEFHKWGAKWGGIHVVIIAVVAAAVMSLWLVRRRWFTNRNRSTDWRFMIIPAVAFVLCAGAGILFTEPARGRSSAVSDTRTSERQSDSKQSSGSDGFFFSSILDLGSSAAGTDVDEGCLLVLLVLLAIALLFGSLFIPHFWVLATFLMTVAMAIFTYREWLMVTPDTEL